MNLRNSAGAALLALASCTATVDRGRLLSDFERAQLGPFGDATIEDILRIEPGASGPLRVGVAPPIEDERGARGRPRWSEPERALFAAWAEELRARGLLAELLVLPGLFVDASLPPREQMLAMRREAARHGLDAVLVVQSLADVDTGVNVLGLLDLTVVGAFVVPGHDAEAACVLGACVLDVRNEYVYASGVGEGSARERVAWAHLEPDDVLAEARLRALEALVAAVADQVTARAGRDAATKAAP